MLDCRAVSTFQYVGDEIYRTNTYLQFGSSRKSLGAVVLLNPGPTKLHNEAKKKLKMNGSYANEIPIDDTMKHLISFMEQTHSKLEGRLYIYHLFYIKSTNNKEAIKLFELLKTAGKYPTICRPSIYEIQQHPWVLIAWGNEKENKYGYYEAEKREWIEIIETSCIPYFRVKNSCPLCPNKVEHFNCMKQLVKQFKEQIEPVLS